MTTVTTVTTPKDLLRPTTIVLGRGGKPKGDARAPTTVAGEKLALKARISNLEQQLANMENRLNGLEQQIREQREYDHEHS